MSTRASTLVGAVVAILIVGAVAVLGYYQFTVASHPPPPSSSTINVACPSPRCVNVTIPSGAGTPPPGYAAGGKTSFGFTPDTITLVIGKNDTVFWTNADSAIHTATSDQGAPTTFDTGNINGGSSAQITFAMPGTYTYHCTYHAWMQGKIIVLSGPVSSTSTTTH